MRFFFHAASLLGKVTDHFVKQIAQPQHVGRRDRKRLSQPQGIKIIDRIVHARMIHLVDNQDDGFAASAKHGGHILIIGGQSSAPVGKKEDDVTCVDGHLCLGAHLLEQDVVCARVDAAGVNEREFAVQPLTVRINAVPRHTGSILYDGDPVAGNSVKEG